jgi:hypothetical protein
MCVQHFGKQGETPPELVLHNGGGIPIYQCPKKEIPPWGERLFPSVLSLLPSVMKTEGKAEGPSRLRSPHQCGPDHVTLLALNPKHL